MKDRTEARYFIPYLAIVDLFASFFTCISLTFGNFFSKYFPWNLLCKSMTVLSFVPTLASALFLLAIAVQRYTGSKRIYFALFWRRATVMIIFAISAFLGIPSFLLSGVKKLEFVYKDKNMTSVNCNVRNDQYPTLENVYYIVVAVILCLNIISIFSLYICIAVVVYRRNRETRLNHRPLAMSGKESIQKTEDTELNSIENLYAKNRMDNSNEYINRNDGKCKTSSPSTEFNKMFVTIIVVYVLTFLPTGVSLVARLVSTNHWLSGVPDWKTQLYIIIEQTWIINNIANPFIYGYFDKDFRKYLKNILPFCQSKV